MTTTSSVDPLLIVGIVIMIALVFVVNIYTLAYWLHPDDKNESYIARIVIIAGLQLSAVSVLMIPIDVANNGGNYLCDTGSASYCGGLDMTLFWKIQFCFIAFFLVVPIPFSTFYYEADDGSMIGDEPKSKWSSAVKSEIALIAIVLLVLLCAYFSGAFTSIPVNQYSTPLEKVEFLTVNRPVTASIPSQFLDLSISSAELSAIPTTVWTSQQKLVFNVDFVVYLIALFGWVR